MGVYVNKVQSLSDVNEQRTPVQLYEKPLHANNNQVTVRQCPSSVPRS